MTTITRNETIITNVTQSRNETNAISQVEEEVVRVRLPYDIQAIVSISFVRYLMYNFLRSLNYEEDLSNTLSGMLSLS